MLIIMNTKEKKTACTQFFQDNKKTRLKFISHKTETSNSKHTVQQLVNTSKSKAQRIICVRKFTVGAFVIL